MASILITVVNGKVVFDPNPLRVTSGALVIWNNQTTQIHHPVSLDPPNLFLTDEIPPDDVSFPDFNVTKPAGTTITYTCSRHPEDGKGVIEVR